MNPPRLNILMTADAVGGVWTYATALARELCARGHRVTLATLGPPPSAAQCQPFRQMAGANLVITDLALEWMDPNGDDTVRAREVLAALERRVRPDLVHLNSFREGSAPWRVPVLVAAHSCVGSWWRSCRGEEPTDPIWRSYASSVGHGLHAADAWLAPTAAFRDEVQKRYAPPRSGAVIWNGTAPADPPPSKQAFVLAAGRLWDEAKNISVLGAVAEQIAWPIHVAGSLRSEGEAACPASLHWLGELPHADLQRQMQDASIFVSPALYEPFGLTVLEAAAARSALVLSDIPSFRELWDGAAVFVEPRNARSLAHALNRLAADAELRTRLQQAAARRARCYSLARMRVATERLYRSVIAQRTASIHAQQSLVELCA